MPMKYVSYGRVYTKFILFGEELDHAATARAHHIPGSDIRSAGFVRFDLYGGLICYGRSVSLDVASHPDDSKLLCKQLSIPEKLRKRD